MSDVLFVCVHNAGRSQMAKAFFNDAARERGLPLVAESAGTMPGGNVHPEVTESMAELGFDLSAEQPRLLENDMLGPETLVFTMGCQVDQEACPALRMDTLEDWGLPDPAGQPPDVVRRIRDEVRRRVLSLVDKLEADRPRA
jgi:arsenate reductase (thioredoxin)